MAATRNARSITRSFRLFRYFPSVLSPSPTRASPGGVLTGLMASSGENKQRERRVVKAGGRIAEARGAPGDGRGELIH
jgi:hypothetical protein